MQLKVISYLEMDNEIEFFKRKVENFRKDTGVDITLLKGLI